MAFERIDGPLGAWRGDYRMAVLASLIANQARDDKKKKTPFQPKDFMPEWTEKEEQTVEQQKGIFKMLADIAKANQR